MGIEKATISGFSKLVQTIVAMRSWEPVPCSPPSSEQGRQACLLFSFTAFLFFQQEALFQRELEQAGENNPHVATYFIRGFQ